jgi:hypothetical protein
MMMKIMKIMARTRKIIQFKYSVMNMSCVFTNVKLDINNSLKRSHVWEGIVDIVLLKELNSTFKNIILSLIKLWIEKIKVIKLKYEKLFNILNLINKILIFIFLTYKLIYLILPNLVKVYIIYYPEVNNILEKLPSDFYFGFLFNFPFLD